MNFLPSFLLCSVLFTGPAAASDLTLIADYWDFEVSGHVDRNGDVQDFEADLGVAARDHAAYSLAWNTGPGWWRPDLAASHTPISAGGQRVVSNGLSFGPVVLIPGSTALGDADLDDTDLTLRYPLRRGRSTLWGGLTIKRIAGMVVVRDQSDTAEDRERIDQVFPLLHLAAGTSLNDWLSLSAQGNVARYRDSEAYELRVGVSLGIAGPLGINLGWQRKHYRVSDGDYLLDATLSGAIAGIFLRLP